LERQKASQFTQGKSGNPSGKKQVTTKPWSPAQRDRKAEHARSTVGQVAAKAGVSMHKARQAAKLDKAVEDGVIPQEVQKEVIAGKKKLRDAVKEIPAKTKVTKKKQRAAHDVLDDLRLLLQELFFSGRVTRQQIIDELTTWIDRAKIN